jgi:hypothetical protein
MVCQGSVSLRTTRVVRTCRVLRAALALVLSGSVFLLPGVVRVARAADCPDAEAQIAFVRERLTADAGNARLWMWGWGIGYTAATLGQAGLTFATDDEGEKVELWVGAGKSALGLIPTLLIPVPALRDAGALDRMASAGGDRCAVASAAEKYLAASADDEAFNRGFLAHTGNVLVNGGGLLVVGLGYDRWLTGTLSAVVGIAIGEVQIYTRPTASLRGRDDWRTRWTIVPVVTSEVTGAQLHFYY